MATEQKRYSGITSTKRADFKTRLDDFCTFTWRNVDMYDKFGAFIINNKDLKFFNGPNYTNEYTKPQFNENPQLIGVNFNIQQISFKIGVYWVSEQEYRQLMNWLNPYIISNLSFGFDHNWAYQCKLTGQQDSVRTIIGYEGQEPRYYTELNLKFELQGKPCAIAQLPYEWEVETTNNYTREDYGRNLFYTCNLNRHSYNVDSDLTFPIKVNFNFNPYKINESKKCRIICRTYYEVEGITLHSRELFRMILKNYPTPNEIEQWSFEYDTESGLMYWKYGDGQYQLLSLLNTTSDGQKMVESMSLNKFQVPGLFEYPDLNLNDLYVELVVLTYDTEEDAAQDVLSDIHITGRARTNII